MDTATQTPGHNVTVPPGLSWLRITEQRYFDLLGCVPPQAYLPHMFLVGENMGVDVEGEGTYTVCLRAGGDHFVGSRAISEPEFWSMEPESPADKLLKAILRSSSPWSVTFEDAITDLLALVAAERGPTLGRFPRDLSMRLRAKLGDCVMAGDVKAGAMSPLIKLIKALHC